MVTVINVMNIVAEKFYPYFFILFLITNTCAAVDTQSLFDSGVRAFRDGHYQQALNAFLQARQQGLDTAVLDYNLAVSYYKTQQYSKSVAAFKRAIHDQAIKQRAQFNLALVYLKQNDIDHAREMFAVAAAGEDARLRALANKQLQTIQQRQNATAQHATKKVTGLISLSYGEDDNVTQTSTSSPTNLTDNYFNGFAYIDIPAQYVTFNVNLLRIDYSEIDAEDLLQIEAGVLVPLRLGSWSLTPSIHYAQSELNSNDYLTVSDFKFSARAKLNKAAQLAFRARYSDIIAEDPAVAHLQGSRQQYRAEYRIKTGIGQLRFRYEFESNNRRNLPATDYSPDRHTLRIRLKRPLFNKVKMKLELAYRDSQYQPAAGVIRRDKRQQLRLDLSYPISRQWTTGLNYVRTDNDSNLASETYKKNDVQAYIEWAF